jgi:hypothetical protein
MLNITDRISGLSHLGVSGIVSIQLKTFNSDTDAASRGSHLGRNNDLAIPRRNGSCQIPSHVVIALWSLQWSIASYRNGHHVLLRQDTE